MKNKVVLQFAYAAVKERTVNLVPKAFSPRERKRDATYFDIWTWNVWKMKWTRMSQHGSGFGALVDAAVGARAESKKIEHMLCVNARPWKPEPLK